MNRLRRAWNGLPPRDRRALVLGLGVMLVAGLAMRGVPALVRAGGVMRERADAARSMLRGARETVAAAPLMRESLAVRAERLVRWAPRLFAGSSASDAQAELSSWVGGNAIAHSVRVLRQDVGPDSSASLFLRLTQRIEAEGDVRGVTGWLAALESGERLAWIEALRVDAPDAAMPATRSERLRVEIVVRAWAAPRRTPAS